MAGGKAVIVDIVFFGLPYVMLVGIKFRCPELPGWLPVDGLVNYYRYFVLGMMVRKYGRLASLLDNPWVYALALILFVAGVRLADYNLRLLNFLAALGGIAALWRFFSRIQTQNAATRALTLIGSHTLPIYLFHYFFLPDLAFLHPYLSTSQPFVLQLVVCTAVCAVIIPLCLFVENLVDRSPALRFLLLGRNFNS